MTPHMTAVLAPYVISFLLLAALVLALLAWSGRYLGFSIYERYTCVVLTVATLFGALMWTVP